MAFMLLPNIFYSVYTLKCSDNTFYTGCTHDLDERIKRHQQGRVKSTAYRLPVDLITFTCFKDRYKAYFYEKYLKSGSGRAYLKKHLI